MRRNLFAWIPVAGVLIQLAVCTAAIAANVKSTTTKTKYRVTGVVKDALGRPIKTAALSLQGSKASAVSACVVCSCKQMFTLTACVV